MTLETYQDTMLALIHGEISAEQAATALFGVEDEITVLRLRDYRLGYLGAQSEGLSVQHPQTRAVVEARFGREGWRGLIERYLAAHPPKHPHRVVAFASFPDFVAADPALPAWIGDLARLERAALLAMVALDTPDALIDLATRVLALDWDVLSWNADGAPDLMADPERRSNLILTWRGPDGEALQAEVGAMEALAITSALRGQPASDAEIADLGCEREDLHAAIEALGEIGALRGASPG